MNSEIQKLVKYSAYIAMLNRLKGKAKISENEYEKIKNRIQKRR